VVALYRSGLSCKDIGDQFGVSATAVHKWLVKANEPRRPSNRPRKPQRVPSWGEYFGHRVEQSEGCLLWTGCRNPAGYGQCVAAFAPEMRLTHRMSWFLAKGPFDLDLHVLHACDTPPCVNPDHLFLGTHTENVRDMHAKGRNRPGAARGGAHPVARLTKEEVLEIRRIHEASELSQVETAKMFGVAPTTVSNIVKRRSWAWLRDPQQVSRTGAQTASAGTSDFGWVDDPRMGR